MRLIAALIATVLAATLVTPAAAETAPAYGVVTYRNVAFAMSDGVTLYGEVAYPADPDTGRRAKGEFPVLVTVNPYDAGAAATFGDIAPAAGGNDFYVRHGYISMIVDARGTGRSGGSDEFLSPRQQRDGAELVQYAADDLDGSNGVVGLIGCSYLGEWTLFNAANADLAGPSPVKAAIPQCASGVFFREFFNVGGLMTTDWYGGEGLFAAMDASPLAPDATKIPTNAVEHALGIYGHSVTSSAQTLVGGDRAYENSWWRQRSPLYRADDIVRNRIPTLLISSYNDIFPEGALEMFTALQNLERGQPAFAPLSSRPPLSPRYQIVMGPGAHASGISQQICLQWLDTWLKGKDTGLQDVRRPLHLFEQGADRWTDTDRYPVANRYTTFHLGEDQTLSAERPAADEGADTLRWVPEQAPDGTLTYATEPFSDAAVLAGPMSATIYATSTRPDVELIATLYDVDEAGARTQVAKLGALVGSQRATRPARDWTDDAGRMVRPYHPLQQTAEEPVPVGEVVRYDIEIPPTVWDVEPGHRLLLKLQAQKPQAETAIGPSPGLVPTTEQAANLAGGQYAIQRNAEAASVVNLPLLPAGTKVLVPSGVDWAAGT